MLSLMYCYIWRQRLKVSTYKGSPADKSFGLDLSGDLTSHLNHLQPSTDIKVTLGIYILLISLLSSWLRVELKKLNVGHVINLLVEWKKTAGLLTHIFPVWTSSGVPLGFFLVQY